MQINEAALAGLYRGYRVLYNEAFQGTPTICDPIVMEVPSGHDQEVYDWLGAMPGMRKLLGEIVIKNMAAITWAVTNDEFESTVAVKQSRVENDTFGIYNPVMSALGLAAKQHKDQLVLSLLPAGFTTKCYTGKNFFDANQIRQAGDAGFTNKGTAKLSLLSYQAARTNILGRLNAMGRPMNLGMKLVLVCGVANEPVANTILKSSTAIQAAAGTVAGTSVGGAIENVMKGTATTLATPYIDASANPNAWFLLETGLPFKPLIWQTNKVPVLTALTSPTSDHVFKYHEFLYQAYGRYAAAYLMPDLAYGSDGSTPAL